MCVEELGHEPATSYDLACLGTHVVERGAHEHIAPSLLPIRGVDDCVREDEHVALPLVVGESDDVAVRDQLVATALSDITNLVGRTLGDLAHT